jgi:hypothetical protein
MLTGCLTARIIHQCECWWTIIQDGGFPPSTEAVVNFHRQCNSPSMCCRDEPGSLVMFLCYMRSLWRSATCWCYAWTLLLASALSLLFLTSPKFAFMRQNTAFNLLEACGSPEISPATWSSMDLEDSKDRCFLRKSQKFLSKRVSLSS